MFQGKEISGIEPDKIVRPGLCQIMEGRRIIENLRMGAYSRPGRAPKADLDSVFHYFPRLKERTGLAARDHCVT